MDVGADRGALCGLVVGGRSAPADVDTDISCAVRPEDGGALRVRRGPGEARREGGAALERAAGEAQRAARRVRLEAGGRRAADGGAARGVEGVPAGAEEPARGRWGGCLGVVEWPERP